MESNPTMRVYLNSLTSLTVYPAGYHAQGDRDPLSDTWQVSLTANFLMQDAYDGNQRSGDENTQHAKKNR